MTKENPAQMAVVGNFNLEAQLPTGKKFSVSGYLFDSESIESINERVDLLHDVLDRQRTRAEIPELEARREAFLKQIEQFREHLSAIENKKLQGKPLSSQEKLTLTNSEVSIKTANIEIEKADKAIAEAKAKVGKLE